MAGDRFDGWLRDLQSRHGRDLTFQEIRRGLQALSSLYVERRGRLGAGAALDGAGKRTAFALFYGPLHFLFTREVVRALGAADPPPDRLVDLGCGTGAAGAAWAIEARRPPEVEAVDRSPWAVEEARWTLKRFGLRGRARCGELVEAPLPGRGGAVLAAFTVNELDDGARDRLLGRLLDAGRAGARVLVLEPLARAGIGWWAAWAESFRAAQGGEDEWRFAAELPDALALLDKAAGLRHRELTGRSLFLPGRVQRLPDGR